MFWRMTPLVRRLRLVLFWLLVLSAPFLLLYASEAIACTFKPPCRFEGLMFPFS